VIALLVYVCFVSLPLTSPSFPPSLTPSLERAIKMDTIKWGLDWVLKAHHKSDALIYQVTLSPLPPSLPPSPPDTERAVMMDTIKWGLDWLLKAHHKADALIYQVASFDDHSYWGPPESFPSSMKRPSFELNPQHPGSDVAGEVAAAFAAASLVFAEADSVYSQTLLLHARQLFDFADTHRGIGSKDFYGSTGYKDELAWAAAWLFKATGEADYLQKAELMFDACCGGRSGTTKTDYDWGDKGPGAQLLLFHLTNSDKYKEGITRYLQTWLKKPKTPKGLTFYSAWGSNRYTANTAFIALMAATYGLNPEGYYVGWAQKEIDYILTAGGKVDKKSGRPEYSYLIGFGYVWGRGRGGREGGKGGRRELLSLHTHIYEITQNHLLTPLSHLFFLPSPTTTTKTHKQKQREFSARASPSFLLLRRHRVRLLHQAPPSHFVRRAGRRPRGQGRLCG